jgi:hypothetical protein
MTVDFSEVEGKSQLFVRGDVLVSEDQHLPIHPRLVDTPDPVFI